MPTSPFPRSAAIMAGLALLAGPGAGAQAGRINSGLQIDPGQTFELGGGQEGGFVVTGRNTGPVAVVVLGKAPGGEPAERAVVAPGGKVAARFAPGEMALLRNPSENRQARLRLTITGDTAALGMTYAANP